MTLFCFCPLFPSKIANHIPSFFVVPIALFTHVSNLALPTRQRYQHRPAPAARLPQGALLSCRRGGRRRAPPGLRQARGRSPHLHLGGIGRNGCAFEAAGRTTGVLGPSPHHKQASGHCFQAGGEVPEGQGVAMQRACGGWVGGWVAPRYSLSRSKSMKVHILAMGTEKQ